MCSASRATRIMFTSARPAASPGLRALTGTQPFEGADNAPTEIGTGAYRHDVLRRACLRFALVAAQFVIAARRSSIRGPDSLDQQQTRSRHPVLASDEGGCAHR